jgi:hypothetical protein
VQPIVPQIFGLPENQILNRILKPLVFVVAAIYFLVDAVVLTLARPIARWLAGHWVCDRVRTWIISLRPYPTLALFMVPVLVLEPVKPVAAYLTATGHIAGGVTVLLVGELLKLVLIERLFCISRDKLMSIAAFAWCYDRLRQARERLESSSVWQLARRWNLLFRHAIRTHVSELKAPAQKPQRLSWQRR